MCVNAAEARRRFGAFGVGFGAFSSFFWALDLRFHHSGESMFVRKCRFSRPRPPNPQCPRGAWDTRFLQHMPQAPVIASSILCSLANPTNTNTRTVPPKRRPDEAKSIDPIDLKLGVVPANSHDCPATMPDPAIYHHLSPLPPGVVLPRSKP